jgi:Flp pilus assembly protein TadG
MKPHANPARRCAQRGAAAVEFALVASLLFMLLFGIIEFGRVLMYWNTAAEATRLGARLAVVCSMNDAAIKTRVAALFPLLSADRLAVSYLPSGCSATTCAQVQVSITPAPVSTYSPFFAFAPTMPPFSTTLPRESMNSISNPVCE